MLPLLVAPLHYIGGPIRAQSTRETNLTTLVWVDVRTVAWAQPIHAHAPAPPPPGGLSDLQRCALAAGAAVHNGHAAAVAPIATIRPRGHPGRVLLRLGCSMGVQWGLAGRWIRRWGCVCLLYTGGCPATGASPTTCAMPQPAGVAGATPDSKKTLDVF